jgi:cytochrome b561
MLKNTENSYGSITKLFHWVVALMIIALLIVGYTMTDMVPSDEKWKIYGMHKATGTIVLILVLLRVVWKLINVEVLLPADLPSWQKFGAKATYFLLYCFMFIMPVSGILMSLFSGNEVNVFGLFTIEKFAKNKFIASWCHSIHVFSSFILSGLVVLHFLAAWYHHLIRKDNILMRMIR